MVMLNSALHRDALGYWHWCPGCKVMHCMPTSDGWTYTGKPADLTANRSFEHRRIDAETELAVHCHYNLSAGQLQFI